MYANKAGSLAIRPPSISTSSLITLGLKYVGAAAEA
jgi:hypothetical protein